MENQEKFNYIYSAKEQAEIKAIRKKYSSDEAKEDKMEYLRRLDSGVTQKAQTVALILGIVGALILGFGMSLFMSELGNAIGLNEVMSMVIGIICGIIGIVPICLAYPAYNRIIKNERAKIAPEILRLTDELMK